MEETEKKSSCVHLFCVTETKFCKKKFLFSSVEIKNWILRKEHVEHRVINKVRWDGCKVLGVINRYCTNVSSDLRSIH